MSENENKLFLRGFAVALADVMRLHGEEVIVRDVLNEAGVTVDQLKRAGVEDYDLREIRTAMAA